MVLQARQIFFSCQSNRAYTESSGFFSHSPDRIRVCFLKMIATETTGRIRASAKPARSLPCNARDLSLRDREMEMGRESLTPLSDSVAAAKLPNSRARVDTGSKTGHCLDAAGAIRHMGAESDANRCDHVIANLKQRGGVESRSSAAVAVSGIGNMATRRRCSHGDLNYIISNGRELQSSYGCSDCNGESRAWVEGLCAAPPLTSRPWRSSSDQTNNSAALLRALASMKKTCGEPNAVKETEPKPKPKPIPFFPASDLCTYEASEADARSIVNPDARTLSMGERGRWGNCKMQQQLFIEATRRAGPASGCHNAKASVECQHGQEQQQQKKKTLQHIQCLHCGSVSTTPVLGMEQSAGSHSLGGRKVRDFTWQQELLQEQKRPEPLSFINKEPLRAEPQAIPMQSAVPQDVPSSNRCQCTDTAELDPGALHMKRKHFHRTNVLSWQERYMLLCRAIAAGAFIDGCPDDSSGPIYPTNRGYSWAVCECAACEVGCGMAEEMSFRQGPSSFCNASTAERMMELEAFSGPIGYVSESKIGGPEMSGTEEKRACGGGGRRWWARLPSFGKSKGNSHVKAEMGASGPEPAEQGTSKCGSCGRREWLRGDDRGLISGRKLCSDCGSSRPIPAAPPTSSRSRHPPPLFSRHSNHLPRRWRLMKLCRYLVGFPLQR